MSRDATRPVVQARVSGMASRRAIGLWSRRGCCILAPRGCWPSRFARTRSSSRPSTRCRSSTRCCARTWSTVARRRRVRRAGARLLAGGVLSGVGGVRAAAGMVGLLDERPGSARSGEAFAGGAGVPGGAPARASGVPSGAELAGGGGGWRWGSGCTGARSEKALGGLR